MVDDKELGEHHRGYPFDRATGLCFRLLMDEAPVFVRRWTQAKTNALDAEAPMLKVRLQEALEELASSREKNNQLRSQLRHRKEKEGTFRIENSW